MEEDIEKFIKDFLQDEIEIYKPRNEYIEFSNVDELLEYLKN